MIVYDLDILDKIGAAGAFTEFSAEQLLSHVVADEVKFDMMAWTDACVFMKCADM